MPYFILSRILNNSKVIRLGFTLRQGKMNLQKRIMTTNFNVFSEGFVRQVNTKLCIIVKWKEKNTFSKFCSKTWKVWHAFLFISLLETQNQSVNDIYVLQWPNQSLDLNPLDIFCLDLSHWAILINILGQTKAV